MLEFGCGAGGFIVSALKNGMDIHGVDVDVERQKQFTRNAEEFHPEAANRFTLYDGRLLPFPSHHFDGCYSWFVFEHVSDPQTSLREICRVLKPGGTLAIFADEVRNAWDGHASVPWPPYLPREFAAAYVEGLGKSDSGSFLTDYVVYISSTLIRDVLTTFGMEIVYSSQPLLRPQVPGGLYVTSNEEARALGQFVRGAVEYKSPVENLVLFAQKPEEAGKD